MQDVSMGASALTSELVRKMRPAISSEDARRFAADLQSDAISLLYLAIDAVDAPSPIYGRSALTGALLRIASMLEAVEVLTEEN